MNTLPVFLFKFMLSLSKTGVFKEWFLDQQPQHHLGIC